MRQAVSLEEIKQNKRRNDAGAHNGRAAPGRCSLLRQSALPLLIGLLVFLVSCGGSSSNPSTPTASTGTGPKGHLISGSMQPSRSGPYGFTVLRNFTPEIASQLKQVGATWVRFQLNWSSIEPQQGQFNWSTLDQVVSMVNSDGFQLDFPLQNAPDWAKSQTCGAKPLLPAPNEVAAYASAVAQRYNGQNGHGMINSFEVGNEEFDNQLPPIKKVIDKNCPGMTLLPIAGADLKAGYQAIKGQSPQAMVGMFAIWWANAQHVQSYMQYLYQNGYGVYFDYANFHYHICGDNPVNPGNSYTSFQNEWQIIHSVMAQNGDSGKPIWVTEAGWPINAAGHPAQCVITPQQQADYMSDLLNSSYSSHVIQEFFWYTLNPQDKGSSVLQASGPLPAYYTFQQFSRQHPNWG